MKPETGRKLHGFTVERVRHVEELSATLVEMTHDKTGAQLCWMDNGEDNKLFCVSFQTLPEDSTGVFHILEHSVLNGSDRYPVREPFVELLKSSMNTFLNAMTYPDKTIYPVSSRNEKDFLNLTSVYLDAVFSPLLDRNPNVFYQEGWHTELNDGVPSYKGVVFNEMKGAMSDVDAIVEMEVDGLLFPDTCYRFNSGGDPAHIPDLSYEQYVDTYRRFYHPSNARFFLDGSVPLDETLEMIDSYLSRYERSGEKHILTMQVPRGGEGECRYEIGEGEELDNKVIFTTAKIIGTWADREKLMAADVLCDLLCDSNESPLKRAILSAGLGEDVTLAVVDGIAQPYIQLQVRNTAEDKLPAIRATVRSTVSRLVEQGIDRAALQACINRYAFRLRQEREPRGLIHAISATCSWMYGGDPLMYLVCDEAIAHLNEMMKGDGYEKLLSELLLDEEGMVTLKAIPSRTYGAELREAEQKRLEAEQAARSEAEQAALEELNAALERWQQTPDTPEQLATLPTLPLSEVSELPDWVDTEESSVEGVKILRHRIPTKGISYLSLYFSLGDCTLEELTQLSLLPDLLDQLPTEHYTVAQLQQEIKTYIGSLRFSLSAYSREGEFDTCLPCLCVRAGVLDANWDKAMELICEILLRVSFREPERIRELAVQSNEIGRQDAVSGGHMLGVQAVTSHYSATAAVGEAINGFTNLQWLRSFVKEFDSRFEDFAALLERVRSRCICRARLIAGVTSGGEAELDRLLSALPQGERCDLRPAYTSALPQRMGIRIPAQASFAVQGYQLKDGSVSDGSLPVLSNIMTLSYLWNEVRVKGGAYGTGLRCTRTGGMIAYSFRDPTPGRTLAVYGGSADFLRAFCAGEEDPDKFIISAIAASEPLLEPGRQGNLADERWLAGMTYERLKETRAQMLATTREKLVSHCEALERMSTEGAVCVVGPETALKDCEDLTVFDL
ncbi:MAG: insulinase family protein [Oscillospiraceae bacterium]|nr:insulinase family protein [Oscillospiraceae bacterium]